MAEGGHSNRPERIVPVEKKWKHRVKESQGILVFKKKNQLISAFKDERELKKQRRKQSNRESARRSRLRKQAECEELQSKVEALWNENNALKDELKRLAEECTKLTSENSSIMEELTRLYGPDVVANLETKFMKTVINSVHGGGGDVQDTSRGGGLVSCQKEGNFFYSNGKLDSGSNKHETILFYSTNL